MVILVGTNTHAIQSDQRPKDKHVDYLTYITMKTECIIHAYNIATLLNLYNTRDAKSTLTCIHYLQMISK